MVAELEEFEPPEAAEVAAEPEPPVVEDGDEPPLAPPEEPAWPPSWVDVGKRAVPPLSDEEEDAIAEVMSVDAVVTELVKVPFRVVDNLDPANEVVESVKFPAPLGNTPGTVEKLEVETLGPVGVLNEIGRDVSGNSDEEGEGVAGGEDDKITCAPDDAEEMVLKG